MAASGVECAAVRRLSALLGAEQLQLCCSDAALSVRLAPPNRFHFFEGSISAQQLCDFQTEISSPAELFEALSDSVSGRSTFPTSLLRVLNPQSPQSPQTRSGPADSEPHSDTDTAESVSGSSSLVYKFRPFKREFSIRVPLQRVRFDSEKLADLVFRRMEETCREVGHLSRDLHELLVLHVTHIEALRTELRYQQAKDISALKMEIQNQHHNDLLALQVERIPALNAQAETFKPKSISSQSKIPNWKRSCKQ